MMSNNISWDLPTKTRWLATMQAHQAADRFIQGNWLSGKDDQGVFRGCFFGCSMQSEDDPLEEAIKDMHLPPWLIYLAEKIFEGIPVEKAKLFPVQLLKAIPVDTDLSGVECKQHIYRLNRLLDLTDLPDNVISAINGVKDCWTQRLNGVPESDIPWAAAAVWSARSARSAAAWSARAAAEAAARSVRSARSARAVAAWSARAVEWSAAEAARSARSARAVEWSAAEAARSARSARATWSAEAGSWEKERDVLIQLLNEVSGE